MKSTNVDSTYLFHHFDLTDDVGTDLQAWWLIGHGHADPIDTIHIPTFPLSVVWWCEAASFDVHFETLGLPFVVLTGYSLWRGNQRWALVAAGVGLPFGDVVPFRSLIAFQTLAVIPFVFVGTVELVLALTGRLFGQPIAAGPRRRALARVVPLRAHPESDAGWQDVSSPVPAALMAKQVAYATATLHGRVLASGAGITVVAWTAPAAVSSVVLP